VNAQNLPALSFVIPVRDDAVRLARCLSSIRANQYGGRVEIIVMDNASLDESADVARAAGATVIVMPDVPVAVLRNAGAHQASGDILAFVDADHEIGLGWIAAAADVLGGGRFAAAGAPYASPPDANWVQRAYNCLRSHRTGQHEVEWLGSGNLAVRREAFNAGGGFDASLVTCEDVDLCNRLRRIGLRIVSDSRLSSMHHGDPSTLLAVFAGELWRGRDNIRVSLRGSMTPRSIPSLAIPVIDLLAVIAGVVGLVMIPWGRTRLLVASVATIALWSTVRAARMTRELRHVRLSDPFANFTVAVAYDVARALALIANAGHGIRRGVLRSATERPPAAPRGGVDVRQRTQ
jgi:Glycosyl transferase family 2